MPAFTRKTNMERRSDYQILRIMGLSVELARSIREWRGTKILIFLDANYNEKKRKNDPN